jgi:cell division protein FtsB
MTRHPDLIPRLPKRLRQPAKSVLRDQLALAADELIRAKGLILSCVVALRHTTGLETELDELRAERDRLRAELDTLRRPNLWQRITRKRA